MGSQIAVIPWTERLPSPELFKGLRSTFDASIAADMRIIIRCKIGEDWRAEDVIDSPLAVVGVVQHSHEQIDRETGEVRQNIRTVLVLENGDRVSSQSPYVAESLHRIMECGLTPSVSTPLMLRVVEGVSRNAKRKYHSLDLA